MVVNLIDITSPPILVSEDSHQTTDISEPKKFTEDLQNVGTNLGYESRLSCLHHMGSLCFASFFYGNCLQYAFL